MTADLMTADILDNGLVQLELAESSHADGNEYWLAAIAVTSPTGWRPLLEASSAREFTTSLGAIPARQRKIQRRDDGGFEVWMAGEGDGWRAWETITVASGEPWVRRTQTYRFLRPCEVAICPGFRLMAPETATYTYGLRAHEVPATQAPACRLPVDWALPFPFHVWHDDEVVALYGLDKRTCAGTLDCAGAAADGSLEIGVYYPDTGPRPTILYRGPGQPDLITMDTGDEVTLTEVIGATRLGPGQVALLEAERLAASLLLCEPQVRPDLAQVARGIAAFYDHCELWEPDALGQGRGWFSNMWIHTQTGPARKRGEMSGYFDLGWGEGIAVEMWQGAVRYWQRTGDAGLLPYVTEMSRSLHLFRRGDGPDAPYFDRSDGTRFGDFLLDHQPGSRIWTHCLGHTGSQLLQLYQRAPDYPAPAARQAWLDAATSMAGFLARHQGADGDVQDLFDEENRELNSKSHRITARVVVCSLWTRLGAITGDDTWLERALALARAVAPEIARFEYYNQMVDARPQAAECTDGEAAWYALEGLEPLYAATGDADVLTSCRQATAFGLAWTYFYDLPNAHRGVARGGQACRMNDFPLLYPIGPAKAIGPLLGLARATGDRFFEQMAGEMASFIGHWQIDAAGKPWHGAIIHALGQYSGQHWGPDLAGQVDTGMATGNGLAAIEAWLEHEGTQLR